MKEDVRDNELLPVFSSVEKTPYVMWHSQERFFSQKAAYVSQGRALEQHGNCRGTTRNGEKRKRIAFCIHMLVSLEDECSHRQSLAHTHPIPTSPLILTLQSLASTILNHLPVNFAHWIITKCEAPQGENCIPMNEPGDLGEKKGKFAVLLPQLGTWVWLARLHGSPGYGSSLKAGAYLTGCVWRFCS